LVLATQNKSEQAELLLKNVVEELKVQMTVDHPLTLIAMQNLALIYGTLGRNIEAARLLNEVLGRQRKVLGNRHPHTLLTMVSLALLYLGQKESDKSEPLFIEAVEGCRAALDRNHETAAGALAGLAVVYSMKPDLKKLGPVLIEARDITCARYGPHDQLTAEANQSVGTFFLVQQDYSQAEPYFRDSFTFWVNNAPDRKERFLNELRLGVCLLAQTNYTEAKTRLISAYNGLKPREKRAIPTNTTDPVWIIEQITQLRDEAGQLINDASLAKLRGDPTLQGILFDLKFPADPFAP
jgi:tetratricopeptide (TPR) repeat protein